LQPILAELEDARWFRPDNLPQLPSALGIARWMLDAAVEEKMD
jgi:NADH pyrophosphatase NudC (nudix superfamily)